MWIETLLIFLILAGVAILANLSQLDRRWSPLFYLAILGLNGLLFLAGLSIAAQALAPGSTPPEEAIPAANGIAAACLGLLISGLCSLFLLEPLRRLCVPLFPAPSPRATPPAPNYAYSLPPLLQDVAWGGADLQAPQPTRADGSTYFKPESLVQAAGFILTLHFVGYQLIGFLAAGGLSGVAEEIGVVGYGDLAAQLILQVGLAVIGVGFVLRRSPSETLARLGLGWPTPLKLGVSILCTVGLVMMVLFISLVWVAIVGEERFEEQSEASEALADSINTWGLALAVAFTAGVGEEIAFRGALQPVFGIWFSALTFVVAHTQYTLTPAVLIIFLVALTFCLLRRYLDTTTAVMTHFLYNFTLLSIGLMAPEAILGGHLFF